LFRIRLLRRRIRREKIFQLQLKYSIQISRLSIRKLRELYRFVFSSKKRLKIVDFVFLKYFIVDRFFLVEIQSNSKSIRSVRQQWSEDFLSRTTQSMQHSTLRHFQRFRERISDRAFTNRSHRVKREEIKISADIEFSFD
jgi:predicted LPLAT superfamily acyltransferase